MPDPTPSDRATSALAGALDGARARVPGDGVDPGVPVAATVVLVRDGADGPEVLLIERPDRGPFAGAWVFPGGKLEDDDRRGADEPEEDVARRAGVRETRGAGAGFLERGVEARLGLLAARRRRGRFGRGYRHHGRSGLAGLGRGLARLGGLGSCLGHDIPFR